MRRLRGRIFAVIAGLILLAVIVFAVAECRLKPLIVTGAKSMARSHAATLLADAVDAAFESGERFVEVIYSDGAVSSIETDVGAIGRLRSRSVRSVADALADTGAMSFSLPIGSITGSSLLSGRGIEVEVRLIPIGDIDAEIYSEFIESGINQTLHRIYIRMRVVLNMIVAADSVRLELADDILVSETVIVGEVPDAYTAINRFEIDENEENDLNDYAATLP